MNEVRARERSPCSIHAGTPSLARCRFCRDAMCDPCLRFYVGGLPACVTCAHELATRRSRRLALSVAFLLVSGFAVFAVLRRDVMTEAKVSAVIAGALAIPVAWWLHRSSRREDPSLLVETRTMPPPPVVYAEDELGAPYRTRMRRIEQVIAPTLSARITAASLLGAMVFVAVALPSALALPRWVGAVSLGVAWLAVEVALPLVFVAFYELVRFSLVRVSRDRHDCRGAIVRSLAWGVSYATISVLPLAVIVYLAHCLSP